MGNRFRSSRVAYARRTAQCVASGTCMSKTDIGSLSSVHRLLLLGSRERKLARKRDWVGNGCFLLLLLIFSLTEVWGVLP